MIRVFWFAFVKRATALKWFAFFLSYPAIVLFWRIPRFLMTTTSWLVPFAVLNAMALFFRSVKYHVIARSTWVIAMAVALTMKNGLMISFSIFALLLLTLVGYYMRFITVFSSSPLHAAYKKITLNVGEFVKTFHVVNDDLRLRKITLTDKDMEKWRGSLETALLYNRISLFLPAA